MLKVRLYEVRMTKTLIFSARKSDFRIDTFCTGGPGGQNQNKREMGVRITHIPTGLSAESRVHRKQLQNRKEAFIKLSRLLVDRVQTSLLREDLRNLGTIRTYHQVDNRVTDHRTGKQATYTEVMEKGLLDKVR